MSTLTYVQCTNCQALGCRKTKDHMNGSFCKLCGKKMEEIPWNDYEYKLHYTKTIHEEGLLPDRLLKDEEQKWKNKIMLHCEFAKPIHGGTMCKRNGITEYCRFDRCPKVT